MKKRFITIIIMIVTCAALAFGITACTKNDGTPAKDADGRVNWATTVFKPFDTDGIGFVGHYVPGIVAFGWDTEWLSGFTMEDLMGTNMPYNNYSSYTFKWQSSKYRVAKIEFDITAETAFETNIYVCNPQEVEKKNVVLEAGETKHIIFECDIKNKTSLFSIEMGAAKDEVMRLVKTKLSNLYVLAEKI